MLHLVTSHFNPVGWSAPRHNYRAFRQSLGDLPVTAIELAFGEPKLGAEITIEAEPQNILWQKERLLNLAIESLPPEVDRVCWIDADVILDDPEAWYEQLDQALDHTPVVQPFESMTDLGPNGERMRWSKSIVAAKQKKGRPGFIWACRREVLDGIGLYDRSVLGSGDVVFCKGATGEFSAEHLNRYTVAHRRDALGYMAKLYARTQGRVTHISHHATHLFHGRLRNRQYVSRDKILVSHDYDPTTDVAIDEKGVMAWAGNKPTIVGEVRAYFLGRREDQ